MTRCRSGILSIVLAASCATGDADFRVRRAPALDQGDHTVSVFGVYKGGRMSIPYWEQIGTEVLGSLGQKDCDTAYGDRLRREDADLFSHIDEDTKDNAITKELLNQLAPHAKGSLILTMEVFGQPPGEKRSRPAGAAVSGQQGGFGGGRRGRGGFGGGRSPGGGQRQRSEQNEDGGFEVELTLFSVQTHDVVASVKMHYAGADLDQGIKLFADKLRSTVPNLTCAGWNWQPGS